MKAKIQSFLLFALLFLLGNSSSLAQSFMKLLDLPESGYYQRLGQFSNGDLLLGDAHYDIVPPATARGFYFIRLDQCGELVWAKDYSALHKHLTFDMIQINDQDEIFAFGSALEGTKEEIYIVKLDGNGDVLKHRIFDGTQIDNFTYSISYKDGQLAIFGFFFHPTGLHESYILVVDNDLDPLWSQKYTPFIAYGEATFTNDGIFYNTGLDFFKISPGGAVEWAEQLQGIHQNTTVSIPLPVDGGIIIGTHYDGYSWFFKLSSSGKFLWKSEKFPSYYHVPNLVLMPDGNILAVYNVETPNGNRPAYLYLSPEGEILEQYQLQTSFQLNSGFTYPQLTDDLKLSMLGNADMDFSSLINRADFLLKFDLNDPEGDCFSWLPYNDRVPNDIPLSLTPVLTTNSNASFLIEEFDSFMVRTANISIDEICPLLPETSTEVIDTVLDCGGEWIIALPDDRYTWEDGSSQDPRTLNATQTVVAVHEECWGTTRTEFRLKVKACPCELFIPNVLSPNQDGINDVLEIESDCETQEYLLQIYDRWGKLVFESRSPGEVWRGDYLGKPLPEGTFYLLTQGFMEDTSGRLHRFDEAKAITLVR